MAMSVFKSAMGYVQTAVGSAMGDINQVRQSCGFHRLHARRHVTCAQATLSGALDVIAVKHANGEIMCTPFHARFGKLQVCSLRVHAAVFRVCDGGGVGRRFSGPVTVSFRCW